MSHIDDMFFRPEEVDEQIEQYLSDAHGAPEEQAARRALQGLQRAYQGKSNEQAPSLERVWQRVLTHQAQESAIPPAAMQAQESVEEQEETRPSSFMLPARLQDRRRAYRPSLFAQMVAVLCLVLIVGSFVLVTTLARRGQPLSSETAPGKAVALGTIHMFDINVGWAMNANQDRVLHTTTGVTHWQDASPAFASPTSIVVGTDFFDPSTAWVAATTGTQIFLYRTSNGGQTWQKAQVPDQGMGDCQIVFLNAQTGWLLVGKGVAAGSEAVDVLRTSDGGATWQVVSVSNANTVNNPAAIPFGGDKSGLSFVNATTGWITGFSPVGQFVWLYVTHDGGATWQHQSISGLEDPFGISTLPPIFFNTTDGILPVVLPNSQSQALTLYVTHNQGASWNATISIPSGGMAGMLDFVDAAHGWVADNIDAVTSNQYKNSVIYRTSDGGLHWTPYTVRLNADISMIDFVSRTQGWAIDSAQTLYQTTDGGQTWAQVTSP